MQRRIKTPTPQWRKASDISTDSLVFASCRYSRKRCRMGGGFKSRTRADRRKACPYASLAHLVEHPPCKRKAPGSKPGGGSKSFHQSNDFAVHKCSVHGRFVHGPDTVSTGADCFMEKRAEACTAASKNHRAQHNCQQDAVRFRPRSLSPRLARHDRSEREAGVIYSVTRGASVARPSRYSD